jgi:hypothetical protein
MAAQDFNAYVSWVVLAIMGRLQEADTLMVHHGAAVRRFAGTLRKHFRQPLKPLYRGLLLEPHEVQNGLVPAQQPGAESVSFSEDRDVACYFADPSSIMSEAVKAHRPGVEGYIAEYTPRRDEVLWHYKWNPLPFKGGRLFDVRMAARQHPATYHDPAQFDYVFDTQKEVILLPPPRGTMLVVTPLEDTCPDTDELDTRFTPPHIKSQFGELSFRNPFRR